MHGVQFSKLVVKRVCEPRCEQYQIYLVYSHISAGLSESISATTRKWFSSGD